MICRSLKIPPWLRDGVSVNRRGSVMRKIIYGGDTETMAGQPITFQFYGENCDDMIFLSDSDRATHTFLRWCKSRPSRMLHVVYVHNLEFDMVSFFWDRRVDLVASRSGEFDFYVDGWHVTGAYGAPTFARITDPGENRVIMLVDSFSYYRASLAKAAEVFCPGLPKLERPDGLGEKRFAKTDQNFIDYAMRDAVIAHHIGVSLEGLHNEFEISQTVSVADMAARIFRHRFMERNIPQPPRHVIEMSMASYHGGKNLLPVEPGWYMGVTALDVKSAYPHAMHGFPSFYHANLYRNFVGRRVKSVPDLGVYTVSGKVIGCKWPSLFTHDFKPISERKVYHLCVAGYELNEAIVMGEFKPDSVSGVFYDAERDASPPPLRAFVEDFFQRKESEKDKPKRAMYKFILNSISGKFIQTRKNNMATVVYVDSDKDDRLKVAEEADMIAGGMFHPFIASLITAHTRARIHQVEHTFDAIHTATDGIYTQQRPTARQLKTINAAAEPKTGLGSVVEEGKGDLLLFRNKTYVLYADAGTAEGTPSQAFADKVIVKYALHGFAGTVFDIERLAAHGTRHYTTKRVNRLRASVKSGATPNEFRTQAYTLQVPARLPVHPAKFSHAKRGRK